MRYPRMNLQGYVLDRKLEGVVGASEKVVHYLNGNIGVGFCDVCIAENCWIKESSAVGNITSTLELFPEFLRAAGTCSHCGRADLPVTRAV